MYNAHPSITRLLGHVYTTFGAKVIASVHRSPTRRNHLCASLVRNDLGKPWAKSLRSLLAGLLSDACVLNASAEGADRGTWSSVFAYRTIRNGGEINALATEREEVEGSEGN